MWGRSPGNSWADGRQDRVFQMKRSLRASREVRFCQVPARRQKKGARLRGTERLFVCLWGPTLSPACRASLPPFPLSFRPPEELTKAPELSDQDTHYFLTSMSMRKFTGSFFCLYWEDKGHTLSFSLPLPNDSWCLLHPWIPPPSQVTSPPQLSCPRPPQSGLTFLPSALEAVLFL